MEPGLGSCDRGSSVNKRVGGDVLPLGSEEDESCDVNHRDPNLNRKRLVNGSSLQENEDIAFTAATGHFTHGEGSCIEGSSFEPTGLPTGQTGLSRITLPLSQEEQLKWCAHMVSEWHGLCDGALQDIQQVDFHVETDKGFKFSELDDSFLCQKKNHFQITVMVVFRDKIPKFVKLKDGSIEPIEKFILCLEGVKFEDINSKIKLKQSKKIDRSKIDYKPITIDPSYKPDDPIKTTVCRLHFSETTANNTRKRGKPNPDQKFFSLVVSLKALTKGEELKAHTIVAHVSERIIVRTSTNVYEVDVDPILEPVSEHENCQKEISVLKSAIKELQDITIDLQQRLGITEHLHHCSHDIQQLHGDSRLHHTQIRNTIAIKQASALFGGSASSQMHCTSHLHAFY